MDWDQEAEELLRQAPVFVRPLARPRTRLPSISPVAASPSSWIAA